MPVNTYVHRQLASPNQCKLSVVEISTGITRPAIGVHTRRYHGSNWLYESDGTGVHIVISNVQCPIRVTWKYIYVGVLCSVDQIIKWVCIPVSNTHTQTAGLDQSTQAQCRRDQRRNNDACYRGIYIQCRSIIGVSVDDMNQMGQQFVLSYHQWYSILIK